MERAVTKKLAGLAKESLVSVQTEARQLLWGAVPPQLGHNRKAWFAYAARVLHWRERRVRAVFNGEARRIDAQEMRQLEALYEDRQQRAAQRRKERDELSALLQAPREPVPLAEQATGHLGLEAPGDRPLGAQQGGLPPTDRD